MIEDYMYHYQQKKTKVFISFYHNDDQKYKDYLDVLLSNNIINKSVADGEYDSNNSDAYIKQLIRDEKVSDSSVIIVLVGPNTRRRKHVDWEIYAGLCASVNGNSGLIGVLLPEFPMESNGVFYLKDLPTRLGDNVNSGYADVYTWNYFIQNSDSIINIAFNNRITKKAKINNSRLQMQRNLGENE